jgi:hypothetical protein
MEIDRFACLISYRAHRPKLLKLSEPTAIAERSVMAEGEGNRGETLRRPLPPSSKNRPTFIRFYDTRKNFITKRPRPRTISPARRGEAWRSEASERCLVAPGQAIEPRAFRFPLDRRDCPYRLLGVIFRASSSLSPCARFSIILGKHFDRIAISHAVFSHEERLEEVWFNRTEFIAEFIALLHLRMCL